MTTEQDQALRIVSNGLITMGLLALAGYIAFLGAPKEAVALIVGIGGPVLLWRHSGRRRRRSSGPVALLPLACAAQLAYGCQGGSFSWQGWPLGGSNADYVRLTAQGSTPAACASPYGCLYLDSGTGLPTLMDASSNKYAGGTAWRARQVAGTPGGVAASDLWYDTAASSPALMLRGGSGSLKIIDSAGDVAPTTLHVAGALQSGAAFLKVCTITSAAAATPVVCLAAADVPSSLSARLATWHGYVNGATAWATTATCVVEDTAGNDLVSIAVAALTGNTFVGDHSANVTPQARYRLGTGGATDAGLQVSCNANGTGSDLTFVLSGSIQ